MPTQSVWSRQILWGNHRLSGGVIKPTANAWANNIVWGMAKTLMSGGDNIVWGTMSGDGDNIVWGTASDGDNVVWGTSMDANVVWGTASAGDDVTWGSSGDDQVVFPEDTTQPLPSLDLEFGDAVPLIPILPSKLSIGTISIGGL
jgi:hypothetical protein